MLFVSHWFVLIANLINFSMSQQIPANSAHRTAHHALSAKKPTRHSVEHVDQIACSTTLPSYVASCANLLSSLIGNLCLV